MTKEQAGDGPTQIGRRLRELRQERGLLQQNLASADISASYISLIEAGKRTPSPAVLTSLAERLGTSVEYLRTGRDEREIQDLRLELGFAEMALRNGDHGEALQAFSKLLTKPSLLDASMLMRARIGQAAALEKLGRVEAALSILHELSEDSALAAGSPQWADVMVALCRCYRLSGDLSMSIEVGERALHRLDSLGLDVTEDHVRLGVDLVGSYYARADYTRAHLLSGRLLDQAEETQSRSARSMVYWNAGIVADSRGQRDEAIALIDRALALMAEGDNLRHLGMLKATRGWLYLRTDPSDPGRAKTLFEQALQALVDTGSVHEVGLCEVGLAVADLKLGLFKEAQEHASRTLGILNNETTVLAAEAQIALGQAQLLDGQTARGEASLRSASRQIALLPRLWSTAGAYRWLGDVWKEHGNLDEALKAYQAGLDAGGAEKLPAPVRQTSEQRV